MFKFTPKNALNEGEEFSLLNPVADRQIKNGNHLSRSFREVIPQTVRLLFND